MEKTKMSSMGRLLAACEAPGWDQVYPGEICKQCRVQNCNQSCAAIIVIAGLAVKAASAGGAFPRMFMRQIEEILEGMAGH